MKLLKRKPTPQDILNLSVFLILIIGIIVAVILCGPKIDEFYSDCNGVYEMALKTMELLQGLGWKSVFAYILVQILQVVIAVIPGMAIQFAGGMVYGIVLGTVYALIGVTIGTAIVFYISRIFGAKAVRLFVDEKTYEKYKHLTETKVAGLVTFVLFLIPGLPKDVFSYLLGLSPMSSKKFFLFSTLGRIPGMLGSCIIGYTYLTKNYLAAILVLAFGTVACVLCVLFRKQIMAFISRENVVK